MMELSQRIVKVLEAHDISVCGEITERTYNNDGYDVELETYSPEGEDVIISLIYDGTEEDFIKQFESYVNDFDADEHAEMWVNSRGKNGVPDSIKDLLEDAEWIKSTLKEVADDLENIDNEEEDTEKSDRDWNVDQLEKAIKEMDEIQARFYMDGIGNEVADILNETQRKLKDIYLLETHEEE